jgi:hypothetical protein
VSDTDCVSGSNTTKPSQRQAKEKLEAEVAAHRLVYSGLTGSHVVRVPKIHHWFQVGKKIYIVMAFVAGMTY